MTEKRSKPSKSMNYTCKAGFFSLCNHLSPWLGSSTSSSIAQQVVTCFLQRDDKVLVLQRGKMDAQYQLWGIPGGKVNFSETLHEALCREVYEETGAALSASDFTLLGSAISKTSTDGQYGLHLYHAEFPQDIDEPVINLKEHLAYQWVTLEEFLCLNLLHAQREAFLFVRSKLSKKVQKSKLLRQYA